jgi:nitrogen regulatory protein PII
MAGFSLICCVVNTGDSSKVMKVAKKYGVKGATVYMGRGTINSRLLAALGLNEIRKEIVTMVIENELASTAINGIGADMHFEKPNHGIAFSYSVSEFIGSKNLIDKAQEAVNGGKKAMYNVIFVVVDKGRAEEVVEAAEKAGSRGGTIINARGAGIHEVQKFFSFEIEPEKEKVFIVTKREEKDKIVASIKERIKIDEPGNGILYVLDVNEAYGLY